MNAAIVVSSVTKKDGRSIEDPIKWQESSEKVVEFWKAQQQFPTYADFLDMNPFYHNWWDIFHDTSKVFKRSFTELIESYSNLLIQILRNGMKIQYHIGLSGSLVF